MTAIPGANHDGSRLAVTCWCERRVLWLAPVIIQDGETGTCNHPDCSPHYATENETPPSPGGT